MWYIIIVLAAVLLFAKYGINAIKYILFEPRLNSAISIIYIICIIAAGKKVSGVWNVVLIVSIIDCICDIIIAKDYYENIECRVDPLYRIKSLASLFTLGLARSAFLLVIEPGIYCYARFDLKKIVKKEKVFPYPTEIVYSHCLQYRKYFNELLNKKLEDGTVLSNQEFLVQRAKLISEKLEESYPKNFVNKLIEMSPAGNESKMKRWQAQIEIDSLSSIYAYIDSYFYNQCKQEISDKMVNHSVLAPSGIVQKVELNCLKKINNKNIFQKDNWIEYFVEFVLNSLVQDGIFEKYDYSNSIWEIYQYKHVRGVDMLVRNADDNPDLALDDD